MLKKSLIILLAFGVGILAWLFFTRNNSVIYRYSERAAVEYSGFVILNPFRDRTAELQAEIILTKLKSKDCDSALTQAGLDEERREYLCLRETSYPLTSCSLMDRRDEVNRVHLIYSNGRDVPGMSDVHGGPIDIIVENTGQDWKVISYDTYY